MGNIICKENKPVTNKEIEFAEQKFQVILPKAYKNLLKVSNGGTLNLQWLDIHEVEGLEAEEGYIYVDQLLGIKLTDSSNSSLETSILDTDYLKQEWGIEQDNIILIAGDGHYWIALDYRKSQEPTITYFDTENEREIHLYNHFDEMIINLYDSIEIEKDEVSVIDFSIENLKEKLFGDSYEMIHEGVMVWEELVLSGNKLEHSYHDRIMEVFKMKGLEFFCEDEQDTLRLRIGLTVCNLLQNERNIIDQKFLNEFLAFLNKSESLAGLQVLFDNALAEYNERWTKE